MAPSSALPAAQPAYILRGHNSQIHATRFIRSNSRLITGDAEGWVVIWSLATKRAVAVWKAHEGCLLGVEAWGDGKLITHGKDNKLIVWQLSEQDESTMSTVLPVDTPPQARKQPWILHILQVNTMNFCAFAKSPVPCLHDQKSQPQDESGSREEELLIAVPNTLSSETVDIFHLPSSRRIYTISSDPSFKGGMIMALSIFTHGTPDTQTYVLTVLAGFESGHTSVSQLQLTQGSPSHQDPISNTSANVANLKWNTTYIAQSHTQPILSLAPSPDKSSYLTTSADAVIAKHVIPVPTPKEEREGEHNIETITRPSTITQASKITQTKHAGQQGLQVRNDGLIFATAGWDGRVRVYGGKSMKELAVLKWHKEGVYSVAFADVPLVIAESDTAAGVTEGDNGDGETERGSGSGGKEVAVVNRMESGVMRGLNVKEERLRKARETHWLVAGSKDGKVSLWDIY